jgi:PAS domain S-box-containing protein
LAHNPTGMTAEIGITRDALLATIVRSSDDAVVALGPDGRIAAWTTGAERLLGRREQDMLGRPLDLLPAGASREDLSAAVGRARTDLTTEGVEIEYAASGGRRLRMLLTIAPIRGAQGQPIGVSLVGRDITARVLAEAALRRSEATSRAFLESASEGIVVTDPAGVIVTVNARTEAMFGYTRGELIGQPVERLIPTRMRTAHVGHREAYLAAPRTRPMGLGLDLAGLRKDGAEFPVEVSLSQVGTDDGRRVIAFITDISERVAFQRAARQADKLAALGTLSAGIAHEINNPIGIITSRVEVMLLEGAEGELPPETRKDLDVILRHARRVAAITQGLLSFARQSSGARGPVNLNRVAEEIVQLTRKDMSRARVEVTLKLDEAMPTIVADANAIGQVLLNLLTNAWRAMPEGGEITIETTHLVAAHTVRLTVRDTGPGIPPEILPKIFDPFFTTKPDGTGLGLSISHGIVQDHRGTLSVRSEVGKGSAFTLSFPLDVPAAGRRPEMEEWRSP